MRAAAAVLALAACGGGKTATSDAPLDSAGAADARVGPTEAVHLIGRFTGDASPRFEWPGSRIATRTSDASLTITLDDTGNNRFDVFVDGQPASVITAQAGVHAYPVAAGLPAGEHDIAIVRRTEAFFGATTFLGFTGATIATPAPTRWIEMVGDSITCGYGVLGPDQSSCFSQDTESETIAWGGLAAADLGAVNTAIAYSGKGVYRNNGGDMVDLVPALFEQTLADDPAAWGFTAYTPDVVVIDLGTNDFAGKDPGQPFVAAYEAFLAAIRGHYPGAWIIVAQSPMLSDGFPQGEMQRTVAAGYLSSIVGARNDAGDARVVYLDVDEQDGAADGYACDYHPSAATHRKMATQLVAKIREITGW